MFEGLALLINVLILVAGLLILNKSSNWTITNSVKIAEITGFGKTTVGFILVALLYYVFSVKRETQLERRRGSALHVFPLSRSQFRRPQSIDGKQTKNREYDKQEFRRDS